MRRVQALLAALVALTACASDEDAEIVGPTRTEGVEYSASTSEAMFDGQFNLLVTLAIENTTQAPVTLTYPAGCPVRIRLYRPSDNVRVYDETRLPCPTPDPVTLSLSPMTTRSFGSGFRGMIRIVGDSLLFTTYRVVAVPQTEGSTVLEIPAGTVTLKQ